MDRAEASEKIKAHCKTIALEMMNLNPTITHLDDQETQEALFEASYELTKQLRSSRNASSSSNAAATPARIPPRSCDMTPADFADLAVRGTA